MFAVRGIDSTPGNTKVYRVSQILAPVDRGEDAGRVINRRIGADRFVLYLHGGLIAIGIILLSQATAG